MTEPMLDPHFPKWQRPTFSMDERERRWSRVRALMDERGKSVKEAGPAIPVQVLGAPGVPMAGDQLLVVEEATSSREIAQRRRMEALQSAAALLDSEKRGALAIDAAELGTWRWDLTANEFSGCNRFGALLGLPGARSGETRWSADRIFALLEPPHRAAFGAQEVVDLCED